MHSAWTTNLFDPTTTLVFAFFIFFLGLVYYLRKEDKREGYPMVSPKTGERELGFPEPPPPKTYQTFFEGLVTLPNDRAPRVLAAEPLFTFPGAPLEPTGDPMVDAVGPASYAQRRETPMVDSEGRPAVLPMRVLIGEWSVAEVDPDPRGWLVVGADKLAAGRVVDMWVDRIVRIVRYLEIELAGAPETRTVLMPLAFADLSANQRSVFVDAVLAGQFAAAPRLRNPDEISAREEDMVSAYFAGGLLYATPARSQPLI